MPSNDEVSDRLICTVLAAQVAAIRDRVDSGAAVDLLWRTTDVLSQLSGLARELARRHSAADPELAEQCASAAAAEAELSEALNRLAFVQTQRDDFARQMADCVVTALERLATGDLPNVAPLSPDDLAAMYVCEDQRKVHDEAVRQFQISDVLNPNRSVLASTDSYIREGSRE